MLKMFELASRLNDMTISLLSDNGEIILMIGSIMIGMQRSADSPAHLVGSEVPLDS